MTTKRASAARMGRPFKGEQPRTRTVSIRLSEVEYERLRAACELVGARSLADFIMDAAMKALRCSETP